MSDASLTLAGAGAARLAGVLDFSTVPGLWKELRQLIDQEPRLELSLAQVTSSNSAGLALLLEAMQKAVSDAHELNLQEVPRDLVDLAGLSNLTDLLGLQATSANN